MAMHTLRVGSPLASAFFAMANCRRGAVRVRWTARALFRDRCTPAASLSPPLGAVIVLAVGMDDDGECGDEPDDIFNTLGGGTGAVVVIVVVVAGAASGVSFSFCCFKVFFFFAAAASYDAINCAKRAFVAVASFSFSNSHFFIWVAFNCHSVP